MPETFLMQVMTETKFAINTHHRTAEMMSNVSTLRTKDQQPSFKRSAQVQYNYNTTAIQEFFLVGLLQLYCTCADPCNTMLQYKFSITCRKLAAYLQQL